MQLKNKKVQIRQRQLPGELRSDLTRQRLHEQEKQQEFEREDKRKRDASRIQRDKKLKELIARQYEVKATGSEGAAKSGPTLDNIAVQNPVAKAGKELDQKKLGQLRSKQKTGAVSVLQ